MQIIIQIGPLSSGSGQTLHTLICVGGFWSSLDFERGSKISLCCQKITEGKEKVAIYDYVDTALPMLQRMFQRRCKGYDTMCYQLVENDNTLAVQSRLAV